MNFYLSQHDLDRRWPGGGRQSHADLIFFSPPHFYYRIYIDARKIAGMLFVLKQLLPIIIFFHICLFGQPVPAQTLLAEVWQLDSTPKISDIALVGPYLYVSDVSNGLIIFDVSDSDQFQLISHFDLRSNCGDDIAVSGNYAYITCGSDGLLIVDISDPTQPISKSVYNSLGVNILGVAVRDNFVFATYSATSHNYSDGGLYVLDVTDPSDVSLVRTVDLEGAGNKIALAGDYAYVTTYEFGLEIVDVADPAKSVVTGSYEIGTSRGVAVSGDYAYVTSDSRLSAIHIGDSAHPTLAGTYQATGNARDVVISGNYAYIAISDPSPTSHTLNDSGLNIVNVSDPAHPALVSAYDMTGSANAILINDHTVYLGTTDSSSLIGDDADASVQLMDVSDPSTPVAGVAYTLTAQTHEMVINGQYAYLADDHAGLQILDLSNASQPSLIGTYNTAGSAYGVTISGHYAYVAGHSAGLQIIDIADPRKPTLTGTYVTSGSAYAVVVSDNKAYVAVEESGLQIIDVTTVTSPTLLGSFDTTGNATDIAISGNYAYVADGESGLQIIDVTDSSHPELVGTYDTKGTAWNVAIKENKVYLTDGTDWNIIDVSNPAAPVLLFSDGSKTYQYFKNIALYGNNVYVTDSRVGVFVADMSDPENPKYIAQTSGSDFGSLTSESCLAVNSSYIFVCGETGLSALATSTGDSVENIENSNANASSLNGNMSSGCSLSMR